MWDGAGGGMYTEAHCSADAHANHCPGLQTQECESLTGVVHELTSSRAKAAAGRMLLQQRWAMPPGRQLLLLQQTAFMAHIDFGLRRVDVRLRRVDARMDSDV